MQEQQQQQVKAILGPRGQLAYYGLRLPQQPQSGGTGPPRVGMCPQLRSVMIPAALHSVPRSLLFSTYQSSSPSEVTTSCANASCSSASSFSMSASPSATSTSSATSQSEASTTPTCNSHSETGRVLTCNLASSVANNILSSVTTTSSNATTRNAPPSSDEANAMPSNIPNSSGTSVISTDDNCPNNVADKVSTGTKCAGHIIVEDSVSSSTSSVSADAGKNETSKSHGHHQEEAAASSSRKSPPPPSRMVTRSQTAAVRVPILMEPEEEEQHVPRMKSQRRSRSFSDKEGGSSPRRLRLGASVSRNVGFDDIRMSKNPAGAGIEFGAVCSDCGAVAVTESGWNAHQLAHRGEGAPCAYCTQVFLTTHGRDAHQQLHREGQKRDVDDYCECALCGGSFISVVYLELHLLELHGRDALHDQHALHLGPMAASDAPCAPEDESGRQLFRCGVCQALFTYSLNLDCHMSLHTEVSYACAVCEASFSSLDPLVSHVHVHHCTGGVPVAATSMPLHRHHHSSPQGSGHRHTMLHRHPPHHSTTTSPPATPFSVWGLQRGKSGQYPTVPPSTCPGAPMGVPLNPMASHMSPAMLNYCMMMSSLWPGDKASSNPENPMWNNYFNPAMTNVFNYINPYLLNGNNKNNNTNLPQNNTSDSKTDNVKPEKEACAASVDGSDEDSGDNESA